MIKSVVNSVLLVLSMFVVSTGCAQSQSAQKATDERLLAEYFAKNNITPIKTKLGLYYVVSQSGVGPMAMRGQTVTVNYTGKTMDGKVFDSNVDPEFKHVDPLVFSVGMGQVIRGWDDGFTKLNRGSKATFYIPSGLAYGTKGMNGVIEPNTILIFDVELLNIEK